MTFPRIYSYFNLHRFILDWLTWKQSQKDHFTQRWLARRANRSSGTLNNILRGRRAISQPIWADLAAAMDLSEAEIRFGSKLVRLEEAANVDERSQALQAIFSDEDFVRSKRLAEAYHAYASRWYYIAIRELAMLDGFQSEPAWLVQRLRYQISEAEAQEALDTLLGLGLLQRDEDGRLTPGELRVDSDTEATGDIFFDHHNEMLRLARAALEDVDPDHRYFCSSAVSIPAQQVGVLRNEIIRFVHHLLNLTERPEELDSEPGWAQPRDTVFQLNVQLFPLTHLPEE